MGVGEGGVPDCPSGPTSLAWSWQMEALAQFVTGTYNEDMTYNDSLVIVAWQARPPRHRLSKRP